MSEHEDLQSDIPAYAQANLGAEARARLETHMAQCQECSELVETAREILSAAVGAGSEMFDPHPEPLVLREVALRRKVAGVERLDHHLSSCASCSLEVSVWRQREQASGATARPAWRGGRGWRGWAPALAAGVAAGLGLALMLRPAPPPPPAAPAPAGPALGAALPSGPLPLLLLPGPLRGSQPRASLRLPPGSPLLILAVQPLAAAEGPDEARYRFEIVDSRGRGVWGAELSARDIRAHLDASDVLTFAVPSVLLPAGGYELEVRSLPLAGGAPLLEIPFDILP